MLFDENYQSTLFDENYQSTVFDVFSSIAF